MRQAIGGIDDKLIEGSEKQQSVKRAPVSYVKWGALAAALFLVVAIGAMILPGMIKGNDPVATPDTPSNNVDGFGDPDYTGQEIGLYEKYRYSVDTGKYSSYVQGKAISGKKIGDKLEDVTVTAGWVRAEGLPQAEEEHARAEIYEIEGISPDVAVAIRFIDELEGQNTTLYFVIMNPAADLTPVRIYVITYSPEGELDGGME